MRIGHPDLWWIAFAPLLAASFWVYGAVARRRLLARVGQVALIRRLLETLSPERRLLKRLLVGQAIALLAFTALRPQFGVRPQPLRRSGIDVAIAFDISKSMLARDVQPSRIDGAREQLAQLLTTLGGDRVALVPFAGVAFTQSPLTADESAISLYLNALDPRQMPIGGTNLAMAIEQCVRLLTGRGDKAEAGRRTRVMLLITDGEDVARDQGEAARAAARKAGEAGIRLYSVAVGTRLGEPIPLLDSEGKHAGYLKDSAGKPVYSKLNLALLEELADLADPKDVEAQRVFHYDGSVPVAGALSEALDHLQKTTIETTLRRAYGEKFQYALLPAILLLLADLLISERRRRRAAHGRAT